MLRRLWMAMSVLSLLISLVLGGYFLVTASQRQMQRQLALQVSMDGALIALNKAVAYSSQMEKPPSDAEIEHLKKLNDTARQLTAQSSHIVTATIKPAAAPAFYRWAIPLAALMSAPGLLWWALPRVRSPMPNPENLNWAENKTMAREVYGNLIYHWQTYAGILAGLTLWLVMRMLFDALWPATSRTPMGLLLEFVPLAYAWIIGTAILHPVLSHKYRRMLAARGFCPFCGYDIHGTSDRCPERGAVPSV